MERASRRQVLQELVSGRTFDEYVNDRALPSAVERQFEILGESVRKVSDALRAAHPEIPWKRIVGLRNILAHRYYAVDHVLLWQIIHGGELANVVERIERLVPPLPPAGDER